MKPRELKEDLWLGANVARKKRWHIKLYLFGKMLFLPLFTLIASFDNQLDDSLKTMYVTEKIWESDDLYIFHGEHLVIVAANVIKTNK